MQNQIRSFNKDTVYVQLSMIAQIQKKTYIMMNKYMHYLYQLHSKIPLREKFKISDALPHAPRSQVCKRWQGSRRQRSVSRISPPQRRPLRQVPWGDSPQGGELTITSPPSLLPNFYKSLIFRPHFGQPLIPNSHKKIPNFFQTDTVKNPSFRCISRRVFFFHRQKYLFYIDNLKKRRK